MRYIRTKDEIFDNWLMDGVMPERISAQTFGIEAIKYANTIEELCDEFVLVDTESGYCGVLPKDKEIKLDKVNMGNAYGRKFYGAIWTEYGLKYVAKINKEGELELL